MVVDVVGICDRSSDAGNDCRRVRGNRSRTTGSGDRCGFDCLGLKSGR